MSCRTKLTALGAVASLAAALTPASARAQESPAYVPAAPGSAAAEAERLLFDQVFGKRARPELVSARTIAPVWIEGMSARNLAVRFGAPGQPAGVEAEALLAELRSWLEDATVARLTAAAIEDASPGQGARGTRWLTVAAMREAGLIVELDEARVELRIRVPAAARRTQVVSFRDEPYAADGPVAGPAPLAAHVNVNAGQEWRAGYAASSASVRANGRQALRSELDGAVNVRGFVAEGHAGYTEAIPGTTTKAWRRDEMRLVRDDPSRMVRYSLGDIQFATSSFARSVPLGGLAASREFSIQPYTVVRPSGRNELFLRARSTVDVYLNGRFVRRLELAPGRHVIRDLPIASGINDVRLEIVDDVGRRETVLIPWVFEEEALGEGINEFTYALGYPSTTTDTGRSYETGTPTISIAHRTGITDRLTAGGFFQANRLQRVAGVSTIISTEIGRFGLEPAASQLATPTRGETGLGAALRAQYAYTDHRGPELSQRTFSLTAETRTPTFAPLESRQPLYATLLDLGASFSQQIPIVGTLSAGAGYQLARDGYQNGNLLSASWVKPWRTGFDTTVSLIRTEDTRALRETTLYLSLVWAIPEKSQYLTASANTSAKSVRADWNYRPVSRVGSVGATVGVERDPLVDGVDARLDYLGNRARLEADGTAARARDGSGTRESGTFKGGTALVLVADGNGPSVAISRPVTDSFALVRTGKSLKGSVIELNPQPDAGPEASTSWLGPGVIPDIASYRYYQLHLGFPEIRAGYTLPAENYLMLPSYRSGVIVEAESESSVYLVGRLVDAAGRPLALAAGELRAEGPVLETIGLPFFTNRDGRFGLEGLRPGRYQIVFFDDRLAPAPLEIPAGVDGIRDIGQVTARARGGATPP